MPHLTPERSVRPLRRSTSERSFRHEDEPIIMNHTTLRVKDYKASLDFYVNNLKMMLTKVLHIGGLSYYILVFRRFEYWTEKISCLILCHQPGTETDPNFKVNTGDENLGFAHLHFSVNGASMERLVSLFGRENLKESVGIDGFMKFLTITDPDGYRIIWKYNMDTSRGVIARNVIRIVFRVKNPLECVDFYRNILGMKLYLRHDDETARMSLYFLGYLHDGVEYSPLNLEGSMDVWDIHFKSGIIELQYLWDTPGNCTNEVSKGLIQGFSHIGFSFMSLHEFCTELENEQGVNLEWAVDENNDDGITGVVVKTKDPAGNSIHFISRTYCSDKECEYTYHSLEEGEYYCCDATREIYSDFLEYDYEYPN